jgi:ABC-2 type transport system ATP-binding protein
LSGFVGPNGAGKSTTLRMLLGLVRPTVGSATVLGEPVSKPARYLDRVGAMIEGPTFHPGLSGRANLRQLAALRRLPGARVDEVLDMVGLAGRADDGFATYSLGMKQRLGIAGALLPSPELLILDEPTNGLDPAGIREIRTLLKNLAGDGMTVFVSSHLLSEVEQICDHLVMIRNGRLLFQGHVTELLAAGDPTIVCCPEDRHDLHRLAGALRSAGLRADVCDTEGHVRAHAPASAAADVNRLAMLAGVTLRALRTHRPSLEETFLEATGHVDGDTIPHGRTGRHDAAGPGDATGQCDKTVQCDAPVQLDDLSGETR